MGDAEQSALIERVVSGRGSVAPAPEGGCKDGGTGLQKRFG
jgi:hypothetical protein